MNTEQKNKNIFTCKIAPNIITSCLVFAVESNKEAKYDYIKKDSGQIMNICLNI